MRSTSIGGPACSSVRPSAMPGITSRAGRMRVSCGFTACTFAIATALAASVVSLSRVSARRATSASPNAGGRQSSCVTWAAGTPSTMSGRPALMTLSSSVRMLMPHLPRRRGVPPPRWSRRARRRPWSGCRAAAPTPADRPRCRTPSQRREAVARPPRPRPAPAPPPSRRVCRGRRWHRSRARGRAGSCRPWHPPPPPRSSRRETLDRSSDAACPPCTRRRRGR